MTPRFRRLLRADGQAEILSILADAALQLGAAAVAVVEMLTTGEARRGAGDSDGRSPCEYATDPMGRSLGPSVKMGYPLGWKAHAEEEEEGDLREERAEKNSTQGRKDAKTQRDGEG